MASISPNTQFSNRILASLSKADSDRILPHLTRATFSQGETMVGPGEKAKFAYFMEEGITSVVTTLADGVTVEVGLLGREGMVGLSTVMGAVSLPFHSFIQVAGSGFRIKADLVMREFERSRNSVTSYFSFSTRN